MNDTITEYAQSRFGLSYLYPYQRLVITNILAAGGADSDAGSWGRQIVILPTGAGKSLCFQLPAAILGGATLVIYPLLSLMNDQERRISEADFTVVQLKGGQDRRERERVAAAITTGTCDFILTNPETLQGARAQKLLRDVRIDHVVIDEAHCISEWGDTFRESYLTLGDSLRSLDTPVVTAFTATASDHVIKRIREVVFPDTGAHLVRGNPDRENITYSVVPCLDTRHAVVQLARSCGAPPCAASAENFPAHPTAVKEQDGTYLPVWRRGDQLVLPAIVFCRTRAETETIATEVAQVLGTDRALFYHAGLSVTEKHRVERAFFEADNAILAATCAYGMGVDKPDIRTVIHTYIPDTVEAFLQESGRAGRDRTPAQSVVLVDTDARERYLRRDDGAAVSPVLDAMFGDACRRRSLLRHLGVPDGACSGCDRCSDPSRRPISPAAELIVESIRSSRQRLTRSEWIAVWRGRESEGARRAGHAGLPGYGLFSRWREFDLERAVDALLRAGALIERHRRISVSRQFRRGPRDSTGLLRPFLPFETEAR